MSEHPTTAYGDPWSEVADRVAPELTVVALGGGHGLAANLSALRTFVTDLTAVVTVADNGGSSGRLRRELGVLPPGDLRQALAALCRDDEWGRTWADVLQHRFQSAGELHRHAVGNLLIVALWELLDGHVEGLDWVGRLLGAQGRVLPMASVPLDIAARVRGSDPDRAGRRRDGSWPGRGGEHARTGRVGGAGARRPTGLSGGDRCGPCRRLGDLGPGSWYTSVLPHLLVPELQTALTKTGARRCVTLNLAPQLGETEGFSSNTYLEVLAVHAPDLQIDVVLTDPTGVADQPMLEETVNGLGAELVIADVAAQGTEGRHDVTKLAAAYASIMGAEVATR